MVEGVSSNGFSIPARLAISAQRFCLDLVGPMDVDDEASAHSTCAQAFGLQAACSADLAHPLPYGLGSPGPPASQRCGSEWTGSEASTAVGRPLFGDSVCHVSFVTFQKPAPILKGARGTPSSCLGLTGTVGAKTLDKKSASRFVTPGMCSRKVSLYTSSA